MWPCIVTNFSLIKPTDALISQIYFCQETLHVSGSSYIHHQEFSTVYSALVYVTQLSSTTRSCLKAVIKPAWHTPVPTVQWKTPDDGRRNCPKHVEFLDKNKFGKLVRLLVLLKGNLPTDVSDTAERSFGRAAFQMTQNCCQQRTSRHSTNRNKNRPTFITEMSVVFDMTSYISRVNVFLVISAHF
jgi:hypothetical protein